MGHNISGVIAETALGSLFASQYKITPPTPLSDGLSFLPLDDQNLRKVVGLNGGVAIDGFEYLTPELISILCQFSQHGDLAYIETEYFGGTGAQAAVVFHGGMIAYGPKTAEWGVINEALGRLGVVAAGPAVDAFDRIGLGRHRSNQGFRSGAEPPAARSKSRPPRRRTWTVIRWLAAIVVAGAVIGVAAVVAANIGVVFRLPRLK